MNTNEVTVNTMQKMKSQYILSNYSLKSYDISGFIQIGGYENLESKYLTARASNRTGNSTCGDPREDAFHILGDPASADNPWPGLMLQSSLGCLSYWCCDQVWLWREQANNIMCISIWSNLIISCYNGHIHTLTQSCID